jgi:hypothetical protein
MSETISNTTRRKFIAVAAAAPAILGAQNKSGSALPVTGEGEHKYEVIHDWGQLPSNIKLGNCHSTVEDSQGHIYLHHTVHADSPSKDAVVEFDDKGKFVKSWGPMFAGGAHGMHLNKEGRTEYLYFCDEKHGIVTKRTLKGEEVWTMGYPQNSTTYQKGPGSTGPGGAAGLNYRPTNIAINSTGSDFWIVDGYGSNYAFHYKQNGNDFPTLVKTFGGRPAAPVPAPGAGGPGGGGRPGGAPGAGGPPPAAAAAGGPPAGGPGGVAVTTRTPPPPPAITTMNNPHGIWLDTRDPAKPTVLVADRGNRRIVRYSMNDEVIDSVDNMGSPCHFHQQKDLLVVPDLASRVYLLDKNNKIVADLGNGAGSGVNRTTQNRSDFIAGKFVAPHGATFDHAGNIFVAEWVEIGRFTKLRKVS